MYQVGNVVKVIPGSYIDLSKNFFNYPERWQKKLSENDSKIMLGGDYQIIAIHRENGKVWYQLLAQNINNEALISENMIVEKETINGCPFRVGDKVFFSPRSSIEDVQYLISSFGQYYNFLDGAAEHTITGILNDYYIFLDYAMDDAIAFPFRWEDFSKKKN